MKTASFARDSMHSFAERDVREYVFGFGRRICPGRELADASLFMFVAMSVAALDIQAAAGMDLSKINISEGLGWVSGTITCGCASFSALYALLTMFSSHPEPFSIETRPRSPTVSTLVRSVELEHPWEDHDAESLAHLNWKHARTL